MTEVKVDPNNKPVVREPSKVHYVLEGDALVKVRLGGREYPLKSNPQCFTCQSAHRKEIEEGLLQSYSYQKIYESLPEGHGVTPDSIRNHWVSHMPLDEAVRRTLIEQRAKELGIDIESYESTLADHVGFAKLVVQRVLQKFMRGELEPDMKDAIALVGYLTKLDEVAGEGVDQEAYIQAFVALRDAIVNNCTPEQIQAIGEEVAVNPVMRALRDRTNAGSVAG